MLVYLVYLVVPQRVQGTGSLHSGDIRKTLCCEDLKQPVFTSIEFGNALCYH